MKSPWLGLLLAVIHGVCGLAILIVSSWFIAACAVASVSFNYMLPAVVIRGLALLRIASGYAHMWVGHHHLLGLTARLRNALFSRLKFTAIPLRAEGVEALATHTESIAAVWVGWVAMQASAIVMLLVSIVAFIVLAIPFSLFTLVLALAWLAAFLWVTITGLNIAIAQVTEERQFRHSSEHYFASSSIWHLDQRSSQNKATPSANSMWALTQRQHYRGLLASWLLQGVAWGLLIVILCMNNGLVKGEPLLLVVPMMLLSASDWLGRSLTVQTALNRAYQGKRALAQLDTTPISPLEKHPVKHTLSLVNFHPQFSPSGEISCCFQKHTLTLIKGSSGSGKSQLLKAVAGLTSATGMRMVDDEVLAPGLVDGWLYISQQPEVLQATLRDNLKVSAPDASDETLLDALRQVGLDSLEELGEWLGVGGRSLSGGERKRLAIARALLHQAAVWLVDEPFEGLDENAAENMAQLLNKYSHGRIVIVASHVFPTALVPQNMIDLDGE